MADATLAAVLERLYPADDAGPGAAAVGIPDYVEAALAGPLAHLAPFVAGGLAALSAEAESAHGAPFAALPGEAQDALLGRLERGELDAVPDGAGLFGLVHHLMLEGAFGDPGHGGNRGLAGWELLGFHGVRLVVGEEEQRLDVEIPGPRRSAADYPELARG